MTGTPKIGRRDSLKEELSQTPPVEVLGTINPTIIHSPEPPPPWETGDTRYAASDARQFVDVPENWELRWINPKTLDQFGWRYWQPVLASDPRVTVKVDTMISPEHNIRRGGQTGDILAWMYRSWVAKRKQELAAASAQLKQSSVDRTGQLKEEFRRGTYGPNVSVSEARHPTHTIADGKSMVD